MTTTSKNNAKTIKADQVEFLKAREEEKNKKNGSKNDPLASFGAPPDLLSGGELNSLIDKPSSSSGRRQSDRLPQTLQDCVGYMKALPLVQPNVNAKDPTTIVDMINILTLPHAQRTFEEAMNLSSPDNNNAELTMSPAEYKSKQLQVYKYNKEPMISLLVESRKKCVHRTAPEWWSGGNVVQPGTIGIYQKFGITYAVPEGRWRLYPHQHTAKWITCSGNNNNTDKSNLSLDKAVIDAAKKTKTACSLLIIRIIEGEVGFVTDQGIPKLLDAGTHVFNSGTVKFIKVQSYNTSHNHFVHGPYHYVNVPRGQYAQVWAEVISTGTGTRNNTSNSGGAGGASGGAGGNKSLVPRLLKEGEHFIKSPFFQFVSLVNVSAEYIGHHSVHILNVMKGHVAKIFHNNTPRLLGEGEHVIESPNFRYCGTVELVKSPCIQHGTITIIQVPQGKVALVWNKNEPFFIDQPGIFEFNSDEFQFHDFVNSSDRKIELGSKKVIQVYTGEVGITYDQGELKILRNGRHLIDSSTHTFERFLSTKQRSIRLITYGASAKLSRASSRSKASSSGSDCYKYSSSSKAQNLNEDDTDLLVCETKDLVKVGVRADVFYSISDPEKCIQTLDTDELEDLVRETAVATLTNIIRSTALNQIAQSKNVSASTGPEQVLGASAVADEGSAGGEEVPKAVSLFFDRAHDEFMSKLHEDFIRRYGVDIANIRMEAFKIMDSKLAEQISRHVLTTAQTENELANLEAQNMIQLQKEQTLADVAAINALAESKALKTRTDAENKRKIDAAQAEAEAVKIKAISKAQAEADVILTKAKAQAEAIRLKAEAESQRAKKLSETNLGQQESLLQIYSDMVKESNSGVSKVIYMDPSVNRDSPFTLGSLDSLNRDLHSLSKMGVAATAASKKGGNGNSK